jgi:hypothetical protein
MIDMTTEFGDIIVTILCIIMGVIVVQWLDRNVFNKNRYYKKDDK